MVQKKHNVLLDNKKTHKMTRGNAIYICLPNIVKASRNCNGYLFVFIKMYYKFYYSILIKTVKTICVKRIYLKIIQIKCLAAFFTLDS